MDTCSVNGCDRPVRTRYATLCNGHYFRVRRTGKVGPAEIRGSRPDCSAPDCDRKADSRGLCQLHARRVAKGGSLNYRPGAKWGPDNPEWKGDAVGYTAAHDRVTKRRGPARLHTCPCGRQASHWAYDHTDPNELVTGPGTVRPGLPYSGDASRYVAMCVPCHKRMDLDRAR